MSQWLIIDQPLLGLVRKGYLIMFKSPYITFLASSLYFIHWAQYGPLYIVPIEVYF